MVIPDSRKTLLVCLDTLTTTLLHPTPGVCVSTHQAILQHSWVSYNLTQFWHYLPEDCVRSTVKGLVSQDCPLTSLQMPSTNPGCHLWFRTTGYKSEVPTAPSLGFNLLERLTDLKKKFYLLGYCLLRKTITQKQPGMQSKLRGKGHEAPHAGQRLLQHLHCSPAWRALNPTPQGFYRGFIM